LSYSFRPEQETLTEGLQRVALSQIDKGLEELTSDELGRSETIHQVRKRCKKIRGLVRLVRPGFDGYKKENSRFRDMARTLSEIRDADVLIETFDRIGPQFADDLSEDTRIVIRCALERRREAITDLEIDARLEQFADALGKARNRVGDWSLEGKDRKTLAGGLAKTYARGVEALDEAAKTGEADDLHEWRKRVKYHGYHLRLLKKCWPEVLEPRAEEAGRLSDLLGDHHDLAVFVELVSDKSLVPLGVEQRLLDLVSERQATLADEAFALGRRLFAEEAEPMADRFVAYWRTSRAAA
jgi:CHAD domain-containing protein